MRALLDANFLIALLDSTHSFNKKAHTWWTKENRFGWASCPITENAVLRVMSNPGYDPRNRISVDDVIAQLDEFISISDHEFYADRISFLDHSIFDGTKILGFRQLTDIYLVALATVNEARLVTFDQRINISAVKIAGSQNLITV